MQSIKSISEELENYPDFHFNSMAAQRYGILESIILQNLLFWIKKNKSRKHNRRDGRTWTYNSHNSFTKIFNFLSIRQVARILKSLIDQGVLITGNYNKHKYDRTTWYAFKDESAWLKANVKANNVEANNVKANNVEANNVEANNVEANNVKANVETRPYEDDFDFKIKALFNNSEIAKAKRLLSKLTKFQQTEAVNVLNEALKCKVIKNRLGYLFGIIKNLQYDDVTPKNEKTPINQPIKNSQEQEHIKKLIRDKLIRNKPRSRVDEEMHKNHPQIRDNKKIAKNNPEVKIDPEIEAEKLVKTQDAFEEFKRIKKRMFGR